MGISIEKEITIAHSQTFKFSSVSVRRAPLMGLIAVVVFDILDENGAKISEKKISYSGEEFNTFWQHFNTGTYLYNQLIIKADLQAPIADDPSDHLEDEFKN